MHITKILFLPLLLVFTCSADSIFAQQKPRMSLQQLTDSAVHNNRLLTIKSLQILEKKAKAKEDAVKKYPSATITSTYQYYANLGQLVIPAGSFGSLPLNPTTTISLPGASMAFELGEHNTFNAGITVYQPITQQFKISTGVDVDETEVSISEREKAKISLQLFQAVERLYYGILIAKKQTEEANLKLELATMKLHDVESALLSGKTIDANKAGLQANCADEEQNNLKLHIQSEDYWADLKKLTGIQIDSVELTEVDLATNLTSTLEQVKVTATNTNIDVQIAILNRSKAQLGIQAAMQSYLPDIGIIAGFSYQKGNKLFPAQNPFIGANITWNLQNIFSNSQAVTQRHTQLQQAEENIANTREQVNGDIEKAYRKIAQAEALIAVAQKAVNYRKDALKVQADKQMAGLNLKTDLLDNKSLLAKAEADLLAATLAYRLAISDVKYLTGE
jgi:outer membrane protein